MSMRVPAVLVALAASLLATVPARAEWKPAAGPLLTRWAKDVAPERAHPEYPRPQMVRRDWQNLNGLWGYAVRPRAEGRPAEFTGEVLVPFPIESALSGAMKRVGEDERLWCRRTFTLPASWAGRRVLLHFGAVDWEAVVWVNGRELGSHRGGYDPFSFDITAALIDGGPQEVVVAAWDPHNQGGQPCGKQHLRPHGIWYTPTTGIWQTVWIEPVPAASIAGLRMTPDAARGRLRLEVETAGAPGARRLSAVALDGGREVATAAGPAGEAIELSIPSARLWSPDSPHLYDLRVTLNEDGNALDQVESYFGLRDATLGKDERGVTRLFLNGKPLFMLGLLDQGFWPDGIYTAPTDEALRYDIEVTRKLGFNMARKHVKVEPLRWYYWCDKLGLLVWQDMPSGGPHVGPGRGEASRSKEAAEQFERELGRLIDSRWNSPSIVQWVVFNEGWGQYDTARLARWVKERDPSRVVNSASGWNDLSVGDVHDIHSYPGPNSPPPEAGRAAVLGEFGGLGLPLAGHTWQAQRNWGYRSFTTQEALTSAYEDLLSDLRPLIGSPGLSAAVYTQTTDVEVEVNGLLTYDRAVIKMDPQRIAAASRRVFLPPPEIHTVLSTSEAEAQPWRYTFQAPAAGWQEPGFDDSSWKEGPGGFGTRGTPGAVVRTEWSTPEIWIRRAFEPQGAGDGPGQLKLRLHHDEDAEVYLNGQLLARVTGYTTGYRLLSIDEKARSALRPGRNTLAARCKQTAGGQYLDLGLVRVVERDAP